MINVKSFVFNFFRENTYLLYDQTKEAVLIDCGNITQHEENTLSGFIEAYHLQPKRLLCTHYHFDHVIGNTFIYHKYGLRPEMHMDEFGANAPTLQMQALRYGRNMHFEEIEPTRYINDDEEIHFGASVLKAMYVPGHSPGSLAFYSEADHFVVSGDVLFPGSIGRTDLYGGNFNQLINSIKIRLLALPDTTIVYSGHGPATTIGIEKARNPFIN